MGLAGVAVATAALHVCSVAAAGGASACSTSLATSAVASAKPRIPSPEQGSPPQLVRPAEVDEVICFDFTRDGRTDLAATVASGGSAGDIGWFVLVRAKSGWRQALARGPSYKVGLFRVGRDLADSQPVYRSKDPNCCPTGGFDHSRWRWNGHRFVLVRSWHTGGYRP